MTVPDIARIIDSLKLILYKHRTEDIIVTSSGVTFIRHLGISNLSFLHKLFPGCNDHQLRTLESIIGFPLPNDYKAFMKFSDGATCFDNTLAVYGLDSNMNRSLRLEEQVPISLENKVNLWRSMGKLEWTPVGSVSAATLSFIIEMSNGSHTRLGSDACGYKQFSSFLECLEVLFTVLESHSNENGLMDDSGFELERDLLALLSRKLH